MENVVINFEANTSGIKKAEADLKSLSAQTTNTVDSANVATQKAAKGFGGLSTAIGTARGNILILNGAMGLLGDKSAELQSIILKVHSALQLVKGVKAFTGLETSLNAASVAAKGYTVSTGAATTATKGFTAAIVANPIGAAIVGITALAAAFLLLSDNAEDASDEVRKINEALDDEDLQRKIDNIEYIQDLFAISDKSRIDILKIQGAERETIHKEELKFVDEEIRNLNLKKKEIEDAGKLNGKISDDFRLAEARLNADRKALVERFNAETSKIEEEAQTKRNEKRKELQAKLQEALKKLRQTEIDAIENEDERKRAQLNFDFDQELSEFANLLDEKIINYQQFNKAVVDLEKKLKADLAAVGRGKEFGPNREDFEAGQKDLDDINKKLEDKRLKAVEDAAKAEAEIVLQIKEELYAGITQLAADFFTENAEMAVQFAEEESERELSLIDQKISDNEAKRNRELISEREFQANQKKLIDEKTKAEIEGQKKINEAKRKADVANRNAKLFEIAIGTARNVIENPGKLPPGHLIPFWIGLGAVQAALVAARPLPKYHSGRLASFSQAEEVAIVRKDETITNPDKSRKYHTTLSAIHSGKVPAMALNDFVRNFSMNNMYTGNGGFAFSYSKNASEMEWQMRGQNRAVTKRLERIERAILEGRISGSDLRRMN